MIWLNGTSGREYILDGKIYFDVIFVFNLINFCEVLNICLYSKGRVIKAVIITNYYATKRQTIKECDFLY